MELLPVETRRLVLRRFGASDLKAFVAYRSDTEVGLYQGWSPMAEGEARAFLKDHETQPFGRPGEWLQVAIALRDSDELIGDIGVCPLETGPETVEIGYTLSRDAWGRGYATEAVGAFVEALFARTPVRRVEATTDTRNDGSVALLRRLGFALERTTETTFRDEPCVEETYVMRRAEPAI